MPVDRGGVRYQCSRLPNDVLEPPPSPVGETGAATASNRTPICPTGYAPEPLPASEGPAKGRPPADTSAPPAAGSTYCPPAEIANGCYYYARLDRREPDSSGVYAMTGYQSQENPYVDPFGHSLGQLWAIDDDNGTKGAAYSTIETGWRKTRNDPGPKLFVYRFDDGRTTCYVGSCGSTLYDCWQPYSGAVETPGNYVGYADVFHKYSINAGSQGSWWVWHDNQWLGYFIGTSENGTNCWTRRPDNLNRIEYGGEVFSHRSSPTFAQPCTDMGNGQAGGSGVAAMFSQTWRSQNNPYSSPYNNDGTDNHVPPYSTGWVKANGVGDFRYGGPGHCGQFNRAPNLSISVTPSQGEAGIYSEDVAIRRGTTFTAYLSGSDPDGDRLSGWTVRWGNGAETYGTTGSYEYQRPGTYVVTGSVRDSFGAIRYAQQTVRVCDAVVEGVCVNVPRSAT